MKANNYSAAYLQQIAVAKLYAGSSASWVAAAVTDSRQAKAGLAFIACRGSSLDGHDYIDDALERGCRFILLQRNSVEQQQLERWQQQGVTLMLHDDGQQALLRWAEQQRQRLGSTTLLAISGSYGKSTTKQLIYSCLSPYYRVSCASRNWNSITGVALSLIQVAAGVQLAIFECGIDHCGEMEQIAALLQPQQALITAIDDAHLEGLHNRSTIAYEKSRLFGYLPTKGRVFLPKDDPFFDYLCQQAQTAEIIPYGDNLGTFHGLDDCGLSGSCLRFGQQQIELPLLAYKRRCLQAALAVAQSWDLSEQQIVDGLRNFNNLEGRGELLKGRYTILQDSYNAPKESVVALLNWLDQRRNDGTRYRVVLADLFELGSDSKQHHEQLGSICPVADNIVYFFLGEQMYYAYQSYQKKCQHSAQWSLKHQELALNLSQKLNDGDVIILKGANGMALEKILTLLEGITDLC